MRLKWWLVATLCLALLLFVLWGQWLAVPIALVTAFYWGDIKRTYTRVLCARRGHDDVNLCPEDVTPFVVCRRCARTGWVL